MKKLVLYDWDKGFKKVSLTELLYKRAGYSLAQAKAITDAVLNHESVSVELSEETFEQVANDLRGICVKYRVIEEE